MHDGLSPFLLTTDPQGRRGRYREETTMPEYKSQEEKAQSTINAQPKDMHRTVIHQILERDIAGWTKGRIAGDLGMTPGRISVIVRSPMYVGMRDEKLKTLHEKVTDKVSDKIANSESVLKEAQLEAAETLVDIMRTGRSESVRAQVAEKIVDRGREKNDGIHVVVQINEKLEERFNKVLGYDERIFT